MSRRVAVIGAGPAGLAAAWKLAGRARVTVFEARSVAGGRLRTEEVAGQAADAAVQLVSDGYRDTRAMLTELGLGDRLIPVPGRDALLRGGQVHELRYGSVVSMVASGALSTRLKLRLGLRYMPFLERHRGVLDLNDPSRAASLDGESIAEWGEREIGEDFVELLAYPLLAAYYGVTPEETSAAFFHCLARAGMEVTVMGFAGGAGRVARELAGALAARGVEFRYDASVTGVEPGPEGVRVAGAGFDDGWDAAVVAVPPKLAAAWLPESAPAARRVRTRSTATMVLATKERLTPGWFGLSIPRREPGGEVASAVVVQSAKETALAGDGDSVVVVPAPSVAPEWAAAAPDDVLAEVLPVLERVLPSVPGVLEARLVRFPDQVLVPAPGWVRSLAPDGGGEAGPDAGSVVTAGDYQVAPTVEGAVRSGIEAARRLGY